MNCPVCGLATEVCQTVRTDRTVERRRKCLVCGHIFYTQEQSLLNGLTFYDAAKAAKEEREKLLRRVRK